MQHGADGVHKHGHLCLDMRVWGADDSQARPEGNLLVCCCGMAVLLWDGSAAVQVICQPAPRMLGACEAEHPWVSSLVHCCAVPCRRYTTHAFVAAGGMRHALLTWQLLEAPKLHS